VIASILLGLTLAPAAFVQDVFVSKSIDSNQGFPTYRIPAICKTAKGSLLAFAEGRQAVSDQAANVLVLRRREASSMDWTPLQVVARDEPASLNNPCVLATQTGRIFLMYQRFPRGYHERNVESGADPDKTCRSFVIQSDDDGRTWSAPRDISDVAKPPEALTVASGPGVGIELMKGRHRGRLVFPFNLGARGHWTSFAVFSDDGGRTWQRGASAPKAPGTEPNETQIAELADGSILLNARNQAAAKMRLESRSSDGGATWETVVPRPDLPDPVCMGSVMRISFAPSVLAFTNPASTPGRINGTLRVSRDEGRTWTDSRVITPGSFAYSCLVPTSPGRVGVLYETVETLPSGQEGYRIRFADIKLPG
jgi:sialidase-1